MVSPADFWDSEAPTFDEQPDHGLRGEAVRTAWSALMGALIPEASRVVDLGCGTGSLSVLLAERGHEVTGIDLSPKMIDLARRKALAASVPVRFHVGDAAHPPCDPGRFDVVLSRHVLWALPDPADVVGRWVDLLDRDGHLVLIEGRWSNGVGLTMGETLGLVRAHGRKAAATPLTDPAYWGGPIDDERYVVTSASR